MTTHKRFKVVIAGGSIAGLTLANMLQANDIDFILLEAYPAIAPQVGASIGLLPHGNRILDQLGVLEEITKLAPPVNHYHFRNDKGQILAEHRNTAKEFTQRHGYPILFLDRQMVLQVLYDNIKDKSKVLTSKRVSRVDLNDNGVTATTADGHTYSGDIIIGADGVHSAVRQEMWRIAESITPGFVPASDYKIPYVYSCVFGISHPCPGIEAGTYHTVFRNHSSYLILGGLGGRCYWFCFFQTTKKGEGSEIPRYTKAEEEEIIHSRLDEPILPTLTFGQMFAKRISSTVTVLPEHVYSKWHYHRIITIGDSAHKFEPIAGYGGNSAFESAAVLVNELVKNLKKSSSPTLTTSQIDSIFADVQRIREPRAKKLVDDSHAQQRLEALETPWQKVTALYLLPALDTDDVMFNVSRNVPFGEKLDMVPLPPRAKWIPYYDELSSKPKSRGIYGWLLIAVYIAISVLSYYGMWIRSKSYGLGSYLEEIVKNKEFAEASNYPLKTFYTGISAVDGVLTFLSAVFTPGVARFYKSYWVLQIYFLGSLVQPIAIWAIESCRKRHALTPISLVALWSLIYQSNGIAITMPLYFAIYTALSNKDTYWWPLSREVPLHYAQSILPAVIFGYVVPTLGMFWKWSNPLVAQGFTAFWQPSPAYVQVLIVLLAYSYQYIRPVAAHQYRKAHAELPDMRYLKQVYAITFFLGLILHVAVVFGLLLTSDPHLSLSSVFKPDWSAVEQTPGEGLRNLWLADFYGFFLASTIWTISAVWDIKRVGRTTVNVYNAAAGILLANILVGPGATMSGVWYWREIAMAVTEP